VTARHKDSIQANAIPSTQFVRRCDIDMPSASRGRMRPNLVFVLAALVAGCGFGDNHLTASSTHHACGDGVLDPGEGCDDGNLTSGDGCSDTCAVEAAHPVCGNGTREVGEACDDGNTISGDGCSATCTVESVCGNGVREAGEACDDGNTASGDGCSPTCQVETAAACGLVPQSGCSGATPACDISGDTTACRAVTASGTSNSHCSADTTCKAGYTCVGTDDPADAPWCMPFCAHDSDCSGTGSRCVIGLLDTAGHALNVDVCSNACDVYGQTGCPTGMGCVGHDATGGDFTDCAYMAGAADGASCTSAHDCAIGSTCVNDSGISTCHPYCVVNNNSTCEPGHVCIPFSSPLVIGTTQYGTCS
jgi:cysteine-rich repeat protein